MFAIFDKVPRNHKVIAIKDCYVLGSKVHMLLLIFIARLFQKYEFQYSIFTNFCTLHNLLYMEFDNRVPAQNNPIEEKLDIDEVEKLLETHYHVDDVVSDIEVTIMKNQEHSVFWDMLGVQNQSEIVTSSKAEIEHFQKYPPAKVENDPLQWWTKNRYS